MIPPPEPNATTRPYRGLSVQDVDVPLRDEAAVLSYLLGREAYRRTEWLVLRNGSDCVLVAIRKASYDPLLSPVVEARVLAGVGRTVWIDSPLTDVGNATALAAATVPFRDGRHDAYVVQGRYEHVNVIWQPAPVRVVVAEVVPPEPAKLLAMAQQAVDYDEDLPPVELVLDAVDIRALAATTPVDRYLLPCRGSGVELPGDVVFLDTRPPDRLEWLLIGCERSLQFHRHFFGDEPPRLDLCPHRRALDRSGDDAILTKCCLLERGVEVHGNVAVVPWGANLDEVRLALRLLLGLGPVSAPERLGAALLR